MGRKPFDFAVIGSGHNGLSAAITLAQTGANVVVYEGHETVGGGARTEQLTIPGFFHDVCSAVHPMAAGSFVMKNWPLKKFGLEWMHPKNPLAHPVPQGPTAVLYRSVEETAAALDSPKYARVMKRFVTQWPELFQDAMGPLGVPSHPVLMAQFGLHAMNGARTLGRQLFETRAGETLFAGIAAHSFLPLEQRPSAAIGLMLAIAAHGVGWPSPKGGAQRLSDAMAGYFESMGGTIRTGVWIRDLQDVETDGPVLFETAPKAVVEICGSALPKRYSESLLRYQHGPGVFKVDWALSEPIPWSDPVVASAGTVHLGTLEEITRSERFTWQGQHAERPYVLLAQPTQFDTSRAPQGGHVAWAYCHVPNGSTVDCTSVIEMQIERCAPGFRDVILAKQVRTSMQYERYNPNFVGGDTVGGANTLSQLFTRPVARINPYSTPNSRLFICSAATPPGGGIHGIAGYYAAKTALKSVGV